MTGSSKARRFSEFDEKFGEQSQARRSFFEKTEPSAQKEKTQVLLAEWNRRFGQCNTKDHVNVARYPEEYLQKIKEEREMWLKGLDDINKEADAIIKDADYVLVITEDILASDQKDSLREIDSKINKFIRTATTFLKEFEIKTRMSEVKLEKSKREIKMIEKLAVNKK